MYRPAQRLTSASDVNVQARPAGLEPAIPIPKVKEVISHIRREALTSKYRVSIEYEALFK